MPVYFYNANKKDAKLQRLFACFSAYMKDHVKWSEDNLIPENATAVTRAIGEMHSGVVSLSKVKDVQQSLRLIATIALGKESEIESPTDAVERNVFVLKGPHQATDPHITVGYAGYLYHLNVPIIQPVVGSGDKVRLGAIKSATRGDAYTPAGWDG